MDSCCKPAGTLLHELSRGALAPAALAAAHRERIARLDPELGAFVHVAPPQEETGRGRLHGLPVAVKDNICVSGWPVTCGSRILRGYRAPYDATAVGRLREAGATLLGSTNLDEFAMGSSSENSAHGPVRNPWDPGRVAGGSSGGSAAAVAAGLVPVALGSDTGGSVRQPAAFCGVYGLKPTYGRVSRYGLVAFASSFDQIGCFSRDVDGLAAVLEIISGADPRDSTCLDEPPFREGDPSGGLRVGVAASLLDAPGVDPEVASRVRECAAVLEAAGAEVREVDLPDPELAVALYYVLTTAEASSNLSRYDGVRYGHREPASDLTAMYGRTRSSGFGREVKRRILLGTYVLSAGYYDAYYETAQRGRRRLCAAFDAVHEDVDLVLLPTAPTPAFARGERLDDPVAMYLADVFTVYANLTGAPGLSIPAGAGAAGLPIGVQVLARRGGERRLFAAARMVERDGRWPVRVAEPGGRGGDL